MSRKAVLAAFTAVRDYGQSGSQTCVDGAHRNDAPDFPQGSATWGNSRSVSDGGFLSEREAAEYLGISTAELVGLRNFDLAMIKEGLKPHGPPPLWIGSLCKYATENLNEWLLSQTEIYGTLRLRGRRGMPLAENA